MSSCQHHTFANDRIGYIRYCRCSKLVNYDSLARTDIMNPKEIEECGMIWFVASPAPTKYSDAQASKRVKRNRVSVSWQREHTVALKRAS